MIIREKFFNYIFSLLLACLAGLSFVYALTTSLHFKYTPLQVLGMVFVFLLVYSLLFVNKLATRISLITFGFIAVSAPAFFYFTGILMHYINRALALLLWVYGYTQGAEKFNSTYAFYIFLLLCALISIFLYFFAVKRLVFSAVLLFGLILFVSQWILNYFVSYTSFNIFLLVILVYYLLHIFLRTSRSNSFENTSIYGMVLISLPLCALVILLAQNIFPISDKPIEWKWMDTKVASLYNYINNNFSYSNNYSYFSITSSGFGNSNSLGGTVKLDQTPVLKVESPRQVYLKANSKDFYTGKSWINTSVNKPKLSLDNNQNRISFDFAEVSNVFYPFNDLALATYKKYFYDETVKITYQSGLKTKSVFVANKTAKITFNNPMNTSVDYNGSLISKNNLGNKFSYTLEVLSPNYNDENFIRMLRKCNRGYYYYDKYSIALKNYKLQSGEDLLTLNQDGRTYELPPYDTASITDQDSYINNLRTTFEYLNDNNTRCIQLPAKLPSRVGDLARTITASANNDYDKVKSIEKYLSKNYPYTLSTKPIPAGRDFVDYFLFDSKEGYCVYYATAMTILVRSIGIPARYVEGYILPSRPVSGNTYQVTNEQAHAWVEVYFEGFGWLPFEPTSPFSSTFYSNGNLQASYTGSFQNSQEYIQYLERIKGYHNSSVPDIVVPDTPVSKDTTQKSTIGPIVILLISIILLMTGLILLFNLIKLKIFLAKLKALPPKESILGFYPYYIKLLSITGIKVHAGETPLEFSNRISGIISEKQNNFKEITLTFIKARYTEETITDKDKAIIISFYNNLISSLKTTIGNKKFFIYRYILGKV